MKTKISLYNFILIISLLNFAISGCKKEENKEFTDSPILESYLEPGNYFTLKVRRQIPFSSDVNYSTDDINNLHINVSYNHSTSILSPLGNGNYIDSSLLVAAGINYIISFRFNSKNVTAYTYVPNKPQNFYQSVTEISLDKIDGTTVPSGIMNMPDPIKLAWNNFDGSYYLVLVENIETTLEPIRDFGSNTPPGNIFRKLPTNSTSEELRPMEFQYFGTHRIILYHVLPDYAALYNENSTISQNLTNPSTSIINGYGIFTGLNSDTAFVKVRKK